jgi:hypothetical protein
MRTYLSRSFARRTRGDVTSLMRNDLAATLTPHLRRRLGILQDPSLNVFFILNPQKLRSLDPRAGVSESSSSP